MSSAEFATLDFYVPGVDRAGKKAVARFSD
jgi:hypothetical protein